MATEPNGGCRANNGRCDVWRKAVRMNCEKCKTYWEIQNAVVLHCRDCERREIGTLPDGDVQCVHFPTCPTIERLRRECLDCANGGEGGGICNTNTGGGDLHIDFTVCDGVKGAGARIDAGYLAARNGKQSRVLDNVPAGVEEYLCALVSGFAAMRLADVEILHGLLNGMDCVEIAAAFGYKSRSAVNARVLAAFRRNPWLESIYFSGAKFGAANIERRCSTWKWWNGKPFRRGYDKNAPPLAVGLPGVSPDEVVACDCSAITRGAPGVKIENRGKHGRMPRKVGAANKGGKDGAK